MEPVLRDFRDADCAKVLQMWEESDEAWPGGFAGGAALTEAYIRDWESRSDRVSLHVIEWGDRIVGYSKVVAKLDDPGRAYLELLNVSPDCHGKGFGRMLVHRAVEDAIARKDRMFDIGTWPANIKSVPLYKKTGFYWLPETDVYMHNYVPQIVNTAMAAPYFARHDWYRTMVRDLDHAPDDLEWHGKKVFLYHWEAGGDLLQVTMDKEAQGITAFENNAFMAAAYVGDEEVPAGIPQRMTWEFRNKGARPLDVTLLAEGEVSGMGLERREHFALEADKTVTQTFSVDPHIDDKEGEIESHIVKTELVIDGRPLTLRCGMKVRQPVAISVDFPRSPLVAGRATPITVCLGNDRKETFSGTVRIAPDPDVLLDRSSAPFTVDAGSRVGVPFELTALDNGVAELEVSAVIDRDGETVATKPERVPVMAPPLGGALGHVGRREARLENADLRVVIPLRGQAYRLEDRHTGERLVRLFRGQVGPPFPPMYMDERKCEAGLEQGPGSVTCVLTQRDDRHPGLVVEKRVTLTGLPLVVIEDRFRNGSTETYTFDFKHTSRPAPPRSQQVTLPLRDGVVSEPMGIGLEYPLLGDIPKETEALAESWVAISREGLVTGLIWQGLKTFEFGEHFWLEFTREVAGLAPGECRSLPPMYAFAGPGSWPTVRGWWQKLVGDGVPRDDVPPEAEPSVVVETAPSPLVLTATSATTELRVSRQGENALDGELTIESPSGWTVEPRTMAFKEVKLGAPFSSPVTITAAAGVAPGAHAIKALRSTEELDYTHALPIVLLGDGSDVAVTEADDVASIENGRMTARVAPGFFGSVYSLEVDGVEQLSSSYPAPGNMGWMRPWHGGIHAFVDRNPGKLYKESFQCEPAERTGGQGVLWRGVKLLCEPRHKDLRGLRLEVEYLSTGGSNVLAVAMRLTNLTSAPRDLSAGVVAFAQPGGTRDGLQSVIDRHGAVHVKKHARYGRHLRGEDWIGVRNPATDEVAALVSAARRRELAVDDIGRDGPHLCATHPTRLEAEQTAETICYFVLARGIDSARAYRVLSKLKEVP